MVSRWNKNYNIKLLLFLYIGLIAKNNIGLYRNRNSNLRYYLNQNKFVWKYISTVLALYDEKKLFFVLYRSCFLWHVLLSYFPFFPRLLFSKLFPGTLTICMVVPGNPKFREKTKLIFRFISRLVVLTSTVFILAVFFSQFLFSILSLAYIY